MKIILDVFENSKDFLSDSLDLYAQGDTDSNYENPMFLRKKWKLAYIALVQAVELLLKHAIAMVSHSLLSPNIDVKPVGDKTITFEQCLIRIVNFTDISINDDEISCLRTYAKLRNQLIHYKVDISTQELKAKYSSLLAIYCSLYKKIDGAEIEWLTIKQKAIVSNILFFVDNLVIKRGIEIRKTDVAAFENDIALAQKHKHFINSDGVIRERVKLGDEHKYIEDKEVSLYVWPYCDDCTAKQGEYHLEHCDLEICPFCYGQALSCDCGLSWHNDLEQKI